MMVRRSLLGSVRRVAVAVLALWLAPAATSAWESPNPQVVPGAVKVDAFGQPDGVESVCRYGYARSIRHPYDAEWLAYRNSLYAAAGIPPGQWRYYRIDHLIPLELGGRPFGILGYDRVGRPIFDFRNVWIEPLAESIQKDAVEKALHAAVCARRGFHGLHLSLQDAQRAIARDWTQTPVGLPPPERTRYRNTEDD